MHPALAHRITGITYMMRRIHQLFERLHKVFGEINPVPGIHVQAV